MSLKIHRILDCKKTVGLRQHSNSNSDTSPEDPHLFRWFLSARGFSDRWLWQKVMNFLFPVWETLSLPWCGLWLSLLKFEWKIWIIGADFFYSAGFPSCCWSTEGNPQHWLQTGKITHWSQAFVIHLQTSKAQGATLFMLAFGLLVPEASVWAFGQKCCGG